MKLGQTLAVLAGGAIITGGMACSVPTVAGGVIALGLASFAWNAMKVSVVPTQATQRPPLKFTMAHGIEVPYGVRIDRFHTFAGTTEEGFACTFLCVGGKAGGVIGHPDVMDETMSEAFGDGADFYLDGIKVYPDSEQCSLAGKPTEQIKTMDEASFVTFCRTAFYGGDMRIKVIDKFASTKDFEIAKKEIDET